MMGEPIHLQAYLPFCDLNLAFPGHREVTRYRRELDLRRAVATVSYEAYGCEYTREIFCSRPSGCLDEHVEDHKALYERVLIRLGGAGADERTGGKRRPTERRVLDIRETEAPSLAALYFQFGRYMLIASSRPGEQPSNLLGIWNEEEWPEWGSKCEGTISRFLF